MALRFAQTEMSEITAMMKRHLASLPSPIDSFLEAHITESQHYRILLASEVAGFASIHESSAVTQFHLLEPHRRHGQLAFMHLRRLESVQRAYVPSCDEFYLSHTLDDYRLLEKQAYFFRAREGAGAAPPVNGLSYRKAELEDAEMIVEKTGTFFDHLEERIGAGEIYLALKDADCVGFGIIERSSLYDDVASVGMFTVERFRGLGVGTSTIRFLIGKCQNEGLRAVAGCWYYNHLSKKTLEKAGMFSQTRLFKVSY